MRFNSGGGVAAMMIALTLAGGALAIDSREAAPKFSATAMDGRKFNNETVKGKVVLVQFWTTWCQYCRRDQDAVDTVAREFGDKLLVLAVNAGESRKKVKRYLEENPRTCAVVLLENTNLGAMFAARTYPKYVLIDERGRIAGEMNGSGGEDGLRRLLQKAGLE